MTYILIGYNLIILLSNQLFTHIFINYPDVYVIRIILSIIIIVNINIVEIYSIIHNK